MSFHHRPWKEQEPLAAPAGTPPSGDPSLPRDYADDLRALRERLTTMSNRARQQLHLAFEAFQAGSNEKVPLIEDLDRCTNGDEVSIDELVLHILAVRHPVAADLRLVVASFRIVTDLERIGDEALEIARQPPLAAPESEVQRRRLREMGDATQALLADALRSFFDGDEQRARRLHVVAAAIEELHTETLRDALQLLSQDSSDGRGALTAIFVARCLERIAAHAVNIGRAAVFVAGLGDMPR